MVPPAADCSSQDESHKATGSAVSSTSIQGSTLGALAFHVHLIRGLITLSDNHSAASTIAIRKTFSCRVLDSAVFFLSFRLIS